MLDFSDKRKEDFWPAPQSRSVGFYSDSSIYIEVLELASKVTFFTKSHLKNALVNNVRGLTYKEFISDTAIENLVKELYSFRWIKNYSTLDIDSLNSIRKNTALSEVFCITDKGKKILELSSKDRSLFYDEVIKELNSIYSIPGWFIQRLWDLNQEKQGTIVIPTPMKEWNPISRRWDDNEWNEELHQQARRTHNKINSLIENGLPIPINIWLSEVRKNWDALRSAQPRKLNFLDKDKTSYTPRKRLALAMKEASIKFLFKNENPISHRDDFDINKPVLHPRTFTYWCARLEELGLINYTDYNTIIPGRIVYPVSSFNKRDNYNSFRIIKDIQNLSSNPLVLFRPKWENIKTIFVETLFNEYKKIYLRAKSLYIGVQDLRDEVCRILKLSSFLFNQFLERAVNESLLSAIPYRISIETDIREDQRNAYQLQRKPVYSGSKLISLIAITNQ